MYKPSYSYGRIFFTNRYIQSFFACKSKWCSSQKQNFKELIAIANEVLQFMKDSCDLSRYKSSFTTKFGT